MNDKLTEKQYWSDLWKSVELPLEIKRKDSSPNILAEIDIFEKYLPKGKLTMLEIGGAPGQYLAYFHKEFGYKVSCIDYTQIGCDKTIENFKILNIPVSVYHKDIFLRNLKLPLFDIVCSFGFVEHFNDLNNALQVHLNYIKPGGILLFGMPNFLGVNRWFLKKLAPDMLKTHNLNSMDINTWQKFENVNDLKVIYKGYIGGFEPGAFLIKERNSIGNNLIFFLARVLNKIFRNNLKVLRKFNSKYTSGYVMGMYQKRQNN